MSTLATSRAKRPITPEAASEADGASGQRCQTRPRGTEVSVHIDKRHPMTPGARVLGLDAPGVSDLIGLIGKGLPVTSLDGLSQALQVARSVVLDLTGISPRTFARRTGTRRLSAEESERVARLARVTERVHAVMGQENGNHWLNQSWPALRHQTPLSYARTDLGAETVIDLIGALDEGIFV